MPTLVLVVGEISTCFSWFDIDMLGAIACENLLLCVARCANSQLEFAK